MPFLQSQRLVERAILFYALMFVALLTLSPMDFAWPARWYVVWWGDASDMPANVLFFMPVGYLFVLARDPAKPRPVWAATLLGLATSLCIEASQQFLPVRMTSLTDVVANSIGAAIGAWMCMRVRARLQRLFPGLLTFDHPLLNVVYLCLPLMGLASIDDHFHSSRTWMLLPLGLMGVIVITALWRYRLAGRRPASPLAVVLAVLAWFGAGASLASLMAPGIVVICATALLGSCLALLARDPRWAGNDGRFEHRVLARLWPCFLVYLAMLVVWRPGLGFSDFNAGILYPPVPFSRHLAIRLVEQAAALTLFGYMAAETLGRSPQPPYWKHRACALAGLACALAMEVGHGFVTNDQASVARGLLSAVGASFGVFLYVTRIDVVRMLRGASPLATASAASNK